MAVFGFIKGIEVAVHVDGQALQEYDDDELEVKLGDVGEYQASRTVSKYIEAAGDKEFSIHTSIRSSYKMDCPALSFQTYVDGVFITSPLCTNTRYQSKDSFDAKIEGVISGPHGRTVLKPFKFSSIKTTTEDSSLKNIKDDSKSLETIGIIRVIVLRVDVMKDAQRILAPSKMQSKLQVHEKALKGQAITHGTGLGLPKPAKPLEIFLTKALDGIDYPLAIFNFKYRSKEALQQLLIIERTPEPEITPARSITPRDTPSISLDSLDATQRSKLEKFLQDLVGGDSSSTPDRKIKRERDGGSSGGAQTSKKSKRRITVDLTADSDDENIESLN